MVPEINKSQLNTGIPMKKTSRRNALKMLGMTTASIAMFPALTIASEKTIICSWNKNFPPYSWERKGEMTGILVECMDELLGKRMGFTVVHQGLPWDDAQSKVNEGKADALCTNPTDTRKQYMYFSEMPFVESLPSIFCTVDNPRITAINGIENLEGLKGFRQVDYKGNGWAQKTFPPYLEIEYVDTLNDAFTKIARGEADIFVGNGLAAMYTVKKMGLKNKIHAREFPVGDPSSFYFGLRRDYPEAQKLIEQYEGVLDEAMLESVTRKIIMHYL